jgi:hypothetical protein
MPVRRERENTFLTSITQKSEASPHIIGKPCSFLILPTFFVPVGGTYLWDFLEGEDLLLI